MRGHQRRGDGRLERDTRLKREKRCLLTSPGRNCAGVLLYNEIHVRRRQIGRGKQLLEIVWECRSKASALSHCAAVGALLSRVLRHLKPSKVMLEFGIFEMCLHIIRKT